MLVKTISNACPVAACVDPRSIFSSSDQYALVSISELGYPPRVEVFRVELDRSFVF